MAYLLHCLLLFISWISSLSFNPLNIFKRYSKHKKNTHQKLIVITGCDSGFGFTTSLMLQELGYSVLSTCLTDKGVTTLRNEFAKSNDNNNNNNENNNRNKVIKVDVTKPKDITLLQQNVEEHINNHDNLYFYTLVNNAGIAPIGHFDWMDSNKFQKCFDVNFFGSVSVIRALLPLLKQTKNSRIIGISSLAGLLSGPGFAAYAASKHACEGFYKSLRQELYPWNIHVSVVNPGFMKTPMINASIDDSKIMLLNAPKEIKECYDLSILHDQEVGVQMLSEDPLKVCNNIVKAIGDKRPKFHYFVGIQAAVLRFVVMIPFTLLMNISNVLVPPPAPNDAALKRIQVNTHLE